ncbi:MAG: hypothetical protein JWM74_4592 [Myxococcaceae bacterium]|nr:hypothetical protein [Myxococcaceae bacterium]
MHLSKGLKVLLVIGAVVGTMLFAVGLLIGGMILLSPEESPAPPPLVRQTVPSASDYYGTWKSADGAATLKVSSDTVSWLKERKSGNTTNKVALEGTFVGISANGSIRMKMLLVSKTLPVSDPPHLDNMSGEWRMTIEGEDVVRSSAP